MYFLHLCPYILLILFSLCTTSSPFLYTLAKCFHRTLYSTIPIICTGIHHTTDSLYMFRYVQLWIKNNGSYRSFRFCYFVVIARVEENEENLLKTPSVYAHLKLKLTSKLCIVNVVLALYIIAISIMMWQVIR